MYRTVAYNQQYKTRGWALDRLHNSRRPLDRLFAFCIVTLAFDLLTHKS